jgi:hypothetical protein
VAVALTAVEQTGHARGTVHRVIRGASTDVFQARSSTLERFSYGSVVGTIGVDRTTLQHTLSRSNQSVRCESDAVPLQSWSTFTAKIHFNSDYDGSLDAITSL